MNTKKRNKISKTITETSDYGHVLSWEDELEELEKIFSRIDAEENATYMLHDNDLPITEENLEFIIDAEDKEMAIHVLKSTQELS